MATGTGLPIPKSGEERTQAAPVINADSYSSAGAWTAIAATGAKIASDMTDLARLEVHQRQTGYLADQEIEIANKRALLRDQHALDPDAFKAAWNGYTDGKLSEAPTWAVNHIKRQMGAEGNSAFAAILNEKRATDYRLDGERTATLAQQASSDYVGSAMAGIPDPAKFAKLKAVTDNAVSSRLMTQEKADLILDETAGRAQGEVAARIGVGIYKDQGYEAAVDHLKKNVLENEALGLKPSEKQRAFNRGLEAINLQRRVDKEDRVGIVQDAKDVTDRLKSNQLVEPGTVQETLGALKRVGAMAQYRELYVESQVSELTKGYRSGRESPAQFARTVGTARETALGTPEQAGAINATAGRLGIPARDLAAAISYETKGTFNPDIQGGKGNNYFGLIQFGPEERAKYGVTPGMTFEQQMGAVENFLRDRGVKPGMGLSDIYRTINGGNPNADLNASDGNGTIAQHITRIQGGHYASADKFLGGTGTATDSPLFAGTIARRAGQEFATQMRKEWPDFKKAIDAGRDVNAEDFDAVRMAAAVSGDAAWIKDVEDAYTARIAGKVINAAPLAQGQAAVDEVRQKFNDTVSKSVEAQYQRRLKLITEDPVGFAMEGGRVPPRPLDFSSPQAINAAVQERVTIARAVSQDQGVAPANPFRPSEVTALSGAITTGSPEQAGSALSAIAGLPDDMLVPALKNQDIRSAITGATRASDPARYNAAMMFADQLWRRAPETAKQMLGEDNVHALMTWQSNQRYMTGDQLAKEREKSALDPQVRERMKVNVKEGEKIARALDPAEVVKQFDTSWWVTPGPIARAIGSQPLAPTDAGTRDALMADYENVFGRRYAETLDKDTAQKQTLEILKTKWQRSELNGGQLMLRAPETVYPAINGSWDWMRPQLEKDLAGRYGARDADPGLSGASNWDYNIVSDRRTEAEAQAGRPPSYVIVVKDHRTGKTDVARREDGTEFRYAFDPGPEQSQARVDFAKERQRVLNYRSLSDNPLRF